ncbi:MAG: DNA mismatch repair protein MutS [Pseudomonadota bacterium]
MKAHLLFPDRDFDPKADPPRQWPVVAQDLEVDTLLAAMAQEDPFLLDVAARALMDACGAGDGRVIAYRQAALRDALDHADEVRALYDLVVEAIDSRKKHLFGMGLFGRYPSFNLRGAVELLQTFVQYLRRLRQQTDSLIGRFQSEAFGALFSSLQRDISDDYFEAVQEHLETLRFRHGVLLSAGLGPGNAGVGYVLHAGTGSRPGWLARLLHQAPPEYTFRLAERDEAGAQALSELVDRGINDVANAMAQATDHVLSFFELLRAELGFYVACLNLHRKLTEWGVALCLPEFHPMGSQSLEARALCDPTLALTLKHAPVSNDVTANSKSLLAVTGANQGGKSTFLRSVGLAQLMLHAGMFVAAEHYAGELASGIYTHYKREEDAELQGGKLDEELERMSEIADLIRPGGLWLSNESFASTNEREGSELLLQVVDALRQRGIKVALVTHLFEAARRLQQQHAEEALMLRAERRDDGSRSFKLEAAQALQTSFGADLYAEVFGQS